MNLTEDQVEMVNEYSDFELVDLYNLIGNQTASSTDLEIQRRYVFSQPDLRARGQLVVSDVRDSLCATRQSVLRQISKHAARLEPVEWVAAIADVILSLSITKGIPPFAVAVALGKMCNWTLGKLCVA